MLEISSGIVIVRGTVGYICIFTLHGPRSHSRIDDGSTQSLMVRRQVYRSHEWCGPCSLWEAELWSDRAPGDMVVRRTALVAAYLGTVISDWDRRVRYKGSEG